MRGIKSLYIIVLLSLLSGNVHAGNVFADSTQLDSLKWNQTDWGDEVNGLQIRAKYVSEWPEGNYLEGIIVEFNIIPEKIPPGIDKLKRFPRKSYIAFNITDLNTGETRKPTYEWQSALIPDDEPPLILPNCSIGPIKLGNAMGLCGPFKGNEFAYQVEYFVPQTDSNIWSGKVYSPRFKIKSIAAEKKYQAEEYSFLYPSKLQLGEGPCVIANNDDFDTVTFQYHPDLHRGHQVQGWGMSLGSGWQIENIYSEYSPSYKKVTARWGLLRREYVFVDGQITSSCRIKLFETDSRPGHMWNPGGKRYKVLWEGRPELIIRKADYDTLATPQVDLFAYHFFLLPKQVLINKRGEAIFDSYFSIPREFKMNKGYKAAFVIRADDKDIRVVHGGLAFPLNKFKNMPTRDKPIRLRLILFQYDPSNYKEEIPVKYGSSSVLWISEFLINRPDSAFEEIPNDRHLAEHKPLAPEPEWRKCYMPRELMLDRNNRIVFDEKDPIVIDFRQGYGNLVVVSLDIGDSTHKYLGTFLSNPLAEIDSSMISDSLPKCKISLMHLYDSDTGAVAVHHMRPFWSKEYELFRSDDTVGSPENGKAVKDDE